MGCADWPLRVINNINRLFSAFMILTLLSVRRLEVIAQ